MSLSIIIAYHNEGIEFLNETLDSIKSTIDIEYEIIIIDDCSDIAIESADAKVIRHLENRGVGAAFDTGVKEAKYDNLFLMGCDVRFAPNNWASMMDKEINDHTDSLICTSVVKLSKDVPVLTFEMSRQYFVFNGATILMAYGERDWNILQAKWLPQESRVVPHDQDMSEKILKEYGVVPSVTESYEIPCILGAAYGVKKSWYNYIDGFWGHRRWGSLEPYISLKSWLFGGRCLTAPHIETAHIFDETQGKHGKEYSNLPYNMMLISWLLFEDQDRDWLIRHLKNHEWVLHAKEMIQFNMPEILAKRKEYKAKMKMSINDFVYKFNLNF